jgi:predicted GNAT family acetyltransferase
VLCAMKHLTRIAQGNEKCVIWSALNEGNADALIAAEIEQVKAGEELEWKYYSHDRPGDLPARLVRHGLTAGATEAVMVYDLSAGLPRCEISSVRMERIRTAADIEQYRLVAESEERGKVGSICENMAKALAHDSTHVIGYVAYVGDEPVTIGRLYTHPLSAFGGLYGGMTRKAYRGRGIYRAMIAARAADAVQLGARYLLVDALPTSRPILERLGFEKLTETVPFTLQR